MGRWEPGTRERLTLAALELYADQGYDGVTVAQIAGRAGTTERTFFRYFADKREVLFDGQEALSGTLVAAVAAAPAAMSPWEVVVSAVGALADFFGPDRLSWSRRRQGLIEANPALMEREVHKLVGLTADLAAALVARGVAAGDAALVAEAGLGVFRVAFLRWLEDGDRLAFDELTDQAAASLVGLVTGRAT